MNARDGYDHAPDYDGHDEPRGTDPKIRRDADGEWFNFNGSWYPAGRCKMPNVVRQAYLAEQIRRDRAAKEGTTRKLRWGLPQLNPYDV